MDEKAKEMRNKLKKFYQLVKKLEQEEAPDDDEADQEPIQFTRSYDEHHEWAHSP